jgi:hypothetical protein
MRLPTSAGEQALAAAHASRFEPYTITRSTQSTGPMGGSTSSSTHTVEMWPFDPTEINEESEFGDRLGGAIGLLAGPSADIQHGDRFEYHGDTYQIEETMIYDGTSDVYTLGDCQRVTNVE